MNQPEIRFLPQLVHRLQSCHWTECRDCLDIILERRMTCFLRFVKQTTNIDLIFGSTVNPSPLCDVHLYSIHIWMQYILTLYYTTRSLKALWAHTTTKVLHKSVLSLRRLRIVHNLGVYTVVHFLEYIPSYFTTDCSFLNWRPSQRQAGRLRGSLLDLFGQKCKSSPYVSL